MIDDLLFVLTIWQQSKTTATETLQCCALRGTFFSRINNHMCFFCGGISNDNIHYFCALCGLCCFWTVFARLVFSSACYCLLQVGKMVANDTICERTTLTWCCNILRSHCCITGGPFQVRHFQGFSNLSRHSPEPHPKKSKLRKKLNDSKNTNNLNLRFQNGKCQ